MGDRLCVFSAGYTGRCFWNECMFPWLFVAGVALRTTWVRSLTEMTSPSGSYLEISLRFLEYIAIFWW